MVWGLAGLSSHSTLPFGGNGCFFHQVFKILENDFLQSNFTMHFVHLEGK